MIKPIKENITLENVKKSNYWDLIAILIWNHYDEKRFQDESQIEIVENWCGKNANGQSVSFNRDWNNPDYVENGYTRTLDCIRIIFSRTDYVSYININTTGNVSIYGLYTDIDRKYQPHYYGLNQTLNIVNWLLQNNFVKYE